ncbi:MAG: hypothetical protein KDD25_08860, partial [Bdellovibrionales bacterium]|nr:hypothetical protein [Bdellovibrionales bacterium]
FFGQSQAFGATINRVELGVHINGVFKAMPDGSTINIKPGDELNVLLRGMPGKVRLAAVFKATAQGLVIHRGNGKPFDNKPTLNAHIDSAGIGYADVVYSVDSDEVDPRAKVGSFRVVSEPDFDVDLVRESARRLSLDARRTYDRAYYDLPRGRDYFRALQDLAAVESGASDLYDALVRLDLSVVKAKVDALHESARYAQLSVRDARGDFELVRMVDDLLRQVESIQSDIE